MSTILTREQEFEDSTFPTFIVGEEERVAVQGWLAVARCYTQGVAPDEFFDDPTPRARECCQLCPVRDKCLEYALRHGMSGWWGGTNDAERRRIRRRRRRADRDSLPPASRIRPSLLVRCPNCLTTTGVVPAGHSGSECLDCGVRWTANG